jgi:hypothetical protein
MEKPMIKFRYENLRNESHVQYHSEFEDVAVRLNPDGLVFNELYDTVRLAELDLLQAFCRHGKCHCTKV